METNVVILSLQLLLPVLNEFAERAELDMPLPIVEERVTRQRMGASKNGGALIIVDGRHQFNFTTSETNLWGRINTYADANFASNHIRSGKAGEEETLEKLAAQVSLIDTNEALKIARHVLHQLGFSESKQHLKPPTTVQFHYGYDSQEKKRWLPFFCITWQPQQPPEGIDSYAFQVEISGLTKKVVRFSQRWIDNTYVDLRPVAEKLRTPLHSATNQPNTSTPRSDNLQP